MIKLHITRLLPWVLVLAVVLLVVPGISHAAGCSNTSLGGGVTCKASASGSNTSGSNLASLSTASTLNVTTGDTLVAAIRYESGCFTTYPQSLFITDTAGNYFQLATSTTGGGGSWCIASYYAPGVIGNASDTVTVYFNTAQAYPAIIVHDLSGLAVTSATSTLDQVALGTAASASSVSTAPFTTTQSTEYLFAAGAVNNTGVSFTAGPGYTDVTTDSGGMISTEQDLVTTIQSAATSSMSAGGTNPWGITAMTLVAGSAPTGSGIPTGHGVVVWGATGYTSSQCGAPSCIMKVTDSAGNTYTTEQTIDDPGANIDEFLAVGPVTSAIAGDGSGWVKCSFYDNNGTTPIPGGAIYCRVFDDSNMASTGSVDSSNNNGGENAGALTVTGGNTDLAFAVYDLGKTGLTATPGSGYTSIIPALLDGEGGMQYAEYEEVTAGTTPTASYSPSNPAGWGLDAALKETTSGGTISYVGGVLAPAPGKRVFTIIQVPRYYGNHSSSSTSTPSIAWISPSRNATVSSIVILAASSTDVGSSISNVAFYVGSYGATLASSTLIGSTSTASGTLYSLSWNTASSTNGSTTLWALATDTSNNTSTASTTVNVENPPVITNPISASGLTTCTITWTTNEAASSQVNYGPSSAYGSSVTSPTLVTSHSVTLTGLTASTTYHFQIVSTDANGNVSTTTDTTFVTGSLPSIISFSAVPAVVASAGTSTLSWYVSNASSVAITPGSFSTSTLIGSTLVSTTSTTTYTITATNANGTSTATAIVAVATAPTAPGSFTVSNPTSSTLSLSWASSVPNNGAAISFYAIHRGISPSNMPQIATTSGNIFTDTGLATSTIYFYYVSAQDSVGNVSASSSIASGTTQSPFGGTTFYIAANGSDSNNGTSKSTPWAHLPGMQNCTANCAAYTPQPGDQFIFRGGDTWGNASLGDTWTWSGTASAPIYIGVDETWYSGSSWTQPIWTCGGTACIGTGSAANYFTTNNDYVTLDNIQFSGIFISSSSQPNYFAIFGTGDILSKITL